MHNIKQNENTATGCRPSLSLYLTAGFIYPGREKFVYTGWFLIIVGVSVAYNFQTGNNEMKLLTEYENLILKVLLSDKYNFLSYTFVFLKQF
jgi:hypothetical protein